MFCCFKKVKKTTKTMDLMEKPIDEINEEVEGKIETMNNLIQQHNQLYSTHPSLGMFLIKNLSVITELENVMSSKKDCIAQIVNITENVENPSDEEAVKLMENFINDIDSIILAYEKFFASLKD